MPCNQFFKSVAGLFLFLVLIPGLVTFLHLRQYVDATFDHSTEPTCWIKPTRASQNDIEGVYRLSQQSVSYKHVSEPPWDSTRWPSIVRMVSTLRRHASRSFFDSTRSKNSIQIVKQQNNTKTSRWCIVHLDTVVACSSSAQHKGNSIPPTDSRWKPIDNNDNSLSGDEYRVFCFQNVKKRKALFSDHSDRSLPEAQDSVLLQGVRKSPNKHYHQNGRNNQSLEFVKTNPATLVLMTINIGLALAYWNWHVPPSGVAKVYSKILNEHELWRSFSGATAHFDALHIGFNMMTLYTLGQELEFSLYQSVEFFFYNISLIPMTTAVFMVLVGMRMKLESTNSDHHANTSTVGYSGVLFAWMVVSCLERPSTCPIPMMPDVCFQTYERYGFKFNLSPLVQLVVAQVIMRRVSFLGHLSGIFVGFLLHWNLLPLEYFQPSVLLPCILFLHYTFGRAPPLMEPPAILARTMRTHHLQQQQDEDMELPGSNRWTIAAPRRRQHDIDDDVQFHSALVLVRNLMMGVLVFGLWPFGVRNSATWSYLLVSVLFWHVVKLHGFWLSTVNGSHSNVKQQNDETSRLTTLYRGFVVMSIISIIVDSMTLSGWMVLSLTRVIFFWCDPSMWVLLVLWLFQILTQLLAICLVVKRLYDLDETGGGGIFVAVFGWTVLHNARMVGQKLTRLLSSRHQHRQQQRGPFEGRGNVLGRSEGTNINQPTGSQEEQVSHLL